MEKLTESVLLESIWATCFPDIQTPDYSEDQSFFLKRRMGRPATRIIVDEIETSVVSQSHKILTLDKEPKEKLLTYQSLRGFCDFERDIDDFHPSYNISGPSLIFLEYVPEAFAWASKRSLLSVLNK